jgi:hypothetical protein
MASVAVTYSAVFPVAATAVKTEENAVGIAV